MKITRFLSGIPPRKRLVLAVRLITFILITVVVVTLLAGLNSNSLIYIHGLRFSHLSVAKGLYKALANNANTIRDNTDPYGPGFTTSEIEILVEYTSDQFNEAPQFIVSSIWRFCYGTFDSLQLSNDNLDQKVGDTKMKNVRVLSCLSPPNYYFNYRSLLGQVGLTIILEYAYDGDYDANTDYQKLMASVLRVTRTFPNTLIFASATQLFIFCVMFVIYGVRFKQQQRKNQLATFLEHLNGILSLACMIAVWAGTLGLCIISFILKSKVESELGDFGITLHLGRVFFSLLWLLFAVVFFNFCAWGGVAWCTVPEEDFDPDDQREHYRKSLQSLSAFTGTGTGTGGTFAGTGTTFVGGTSYDDEFKNDLTFVSRSNTGYSSNFFSTRRGNDKFATLQQQRPSRKGSTKLVNNSNINNNTNSRSRAGSLGTRTILEVNPFSDSLNNSTHNNSTENSRSNTLISKNIFKRDKRNNNKDKDTDLEDSNYLRSSNDNYLQPVKSNSDLISMVSENDIYAHDVDYDQILQDNAYNTGFGLRKNGTIKNDLFKTSETNKPRDIEEFFSEQQYGNGTHHHDFH